MYLNISGLLCAAYNDPLIILYCIGGEAMIDRPLVDGIKMDVDNESAAFHQYINITENIPVG